MEKQDIKSGKLTMKGVTRRILDVSLKASRKFMRSNPPGFIIIGAQKSGTSSLHYYLNQHPDLCGCRQKELHYFSRHIHFGMTIEEYESNFKSFRSKKHFESTPAYLYHPGSIELIKKTYPDIRLIAVLRDPVNRAYSAWNHYWGAFEKNRSREVKIKNRLPGDFLYVKFFEDRKEFPSFRECIDIELELIESNNGFEPALLRRGLYLEQLKRCWDAFGRDRVLVIGFSDLLKDTVAALRKITDFLGVRDVGWEFLDQQPRNVKQYKSPMSGEDRLFLEKFYSEPNRKLFDEIGSINW